MSEKLNEKGPLTTNLFVVTYCDENGKERWRKVRFETTKLTDAKKLAREKFGDKFVTIEGPIQNEEREVPTLGERFLQRVSDVLDLSERKDEDGARTFTTFAAWKRAAKAIDAKVWFDGDEDIAQAMVGPKPFKNNETRSIGEWDGSEGVIYKLKNLTEALNKKSPGEKLFIVSSKRKGGKIEVYAKDKEEALDRAAVHDEAGRFTGPLGGDVTVELVKEEREIPSWFKSGARVRLVPEYADYKNPKEIFTLSQVDTERGRAWLGDKKGSGWFVRVSQVEPANRKKVNEKLSSDAMPHEKWTIVVNGQDLKGSNGKVLTFGSRFAAQQHIEESAKLIKAAAKPKRCVQEDANLQSLGKSLKSGGSSAKPTEVDDAEPDNDADDASDESNDVNSAPITQDETPEAPVFKVGDKVKPLSGDHKGEVHKVVKVHSDGTLDIVPVSIPPSEVKYPEKNGEKGANAKPEQLELAESMLGKVSILRSLTTEEIKGWKNAAADIARARQKGRDETKMVELARLNISGAESKMNDARKRFSSEDEAIAHHQNLVKLNPKSKIRHNLYVNGKMVRVLDEKEAK